jgi:hypothetical protein
MRNKSIGVCFLVVIFIFSACTNAEGPHTQRETTISTIQPKQIETIKPNTVEVQDFTSDCSKVVIPSNVERDTNLDKEKGLLTVHWYDNSKSKNVGVVFRYTDRNCSESVNQLIQHVLKIEKPTAKEGIEELFESSLTKVEGDGYSFQYIIKNNSQKELTLTFNTSQEFNYILWRKDAKGTMVYDFSKDKSFSKRFHKKTLKSGEELAYNIELSHDYEPQTYILEVYMTSNEPELGSPTKFHQNLEFSVNKSHSVLDNNQEKDIINPQYSYSIDIPDYWEGKYTYNIKDGNMWFRYVSKDKQFSPTIFYIYTISNDKIEEFENNNENEFIKLGHRDGITFYSVYPLDFELDSSSEIEEYNQMHDEVTNIVHTFKFIEK